VKPEHRSRVLLLVSKQGDRYNLTSAEGGDHLERTRWISRLKTAVDGIELIDPDLLPESFRGEVFSTVREHKTLLDDVRRRGELCELLRRLAEIGDRAGDRTWYFWEKASEELRGYLGAEHGIFYRLAGEGILHKIHPLLPEEESTDERLEGTLDQNPSPARIEGFAQSHYLIMGSRTEHPIVVLFQTGPPFPLIARAELGLLAEMESVLFDIFRVHLPSPPKTELLQITPVADDAGRT